MVNYQTIRGENSNNNDEEYEMSSNFQRASGSYELVWNVSDSTSELKSFD